MTIKYVLFDWDDTLADTSGVLDDIVNSKEVHNLLLKTGLKISYKDAKIALMKTADGINVSKKRRIFTFLGWLDAFFINAGISATIVRKFKLFKLFGEFMLRRIKLKNGAIPLLNYLANKDLKIILITNSFKLRVVREMKKLGVNHYFYRRYYADKHKKKSTLKPFKIFLKRTLFKGRIDPAKCIMVGDDPVEDLAAKQLGIKTIFLKGPRFTLKEGEKYADYKAKDLYDVKKIIANILSTDEQKKK